MASWRPVNMRCPSVSTSKWLHMWHSNGPGTDTQWPHDTPHLHSVAPPRNISDNTTGSGTVDSYEGVMVSPMCSEICKKFMVPIVGLFHTNVGESTDGLGTLARMHPPAGGVQASDPRNQVNANHVSAATPASSSVQHAITPQAVVSSEKKTEEIRASTGNQRGT